MRIGDGQRIDALAVGGAKPTFEIGAPHAVGFIGVRQRIGVRRGAPALLARHHQPFALQQLPDGAGRWPTAPGLVALEDPLELPRAPAHVRLPQLQDYLLDVLRRLVVMPTSGTAVFGQSGCSSAPVAPQPDIAGLARNLIPLAQLGHRSLAPLVLKYKPQFFFHHTARFPWHALSFTRTGHWLTVSGMPPV